MNKVWIAGAGYLGLPLAALLSEQGFDVTASARRPQAFAKWHAWDFEQVTHTLQDFQAALTWVVLLPPSSSDHYVQYMQNLCGLAQKAGVQHVVYTSSTSVYGQQERVCDEQSVLSPQTIASQNIVACERIWLDSDLPTVSILRLGGLYDDERHSVRRLSGRVGLAGALQPVNVLHKRDALQALCDVVAAPKESVLNVVGQAHPSRAEFYTQEAQRLGLPVPMFDAHDTHSGKIVRSCYWYWSF